MPKFGSYGRGMCGFPETNSGSERKLVIYKCQQLIKFWSGKAYSILNQLDWKI